MIQIGTYNTLKVSRKVDFGFYLDDGNKGILLPNRFAPKNLSIGDEIKVFLYHDSENRITATTESPKAIVGDIALLKAVSVMPQGAFLDWGLMKDLFVAKSQQLTGMRVGGSYLVKLYIDQQTGRIAATEKIDYQLNNDDLQLKELDEVDLIAYRKSDLGYVMIINNQHIGLLHNNEIFQNINIGDKLTGYIKTIRPDNKIDVVLGKPGYQKINDETEKILTLLQEHNGFLPYNDKSEPDVIYNFFGMSKKTFKMTIGALYKQRKITFERDGIALTTK
jgi:predicted RNA-binding protein (virulence factor B family)